jgi:putative transposase
VHSDRGSQFTSREWLDALEKVDAKASMGRVGVCWDNAPAESWFGGFKNELVHPIGAFTTRHEAKVEIARYIRWHNTTRRHSALHMLAPHDLGTSPYPDPCCLISRCPFPRGKPTR